MPSSQLTLRNVDPALSRRLRAISTERGESLNRTVLQLLQDAVGLNERYERLRRYATFLRVSVPKAKPITRLSVLWAVI